MTSISIGLQKIKNQIFQTGIRFSSYFRVGKLIVTKAIGYMSDDLETDYENITENYKAREGSLNERLTYMKALRHSNTVDPNRFPGMRNNDVFLQMIDLDKGIYGQPFLVSLFLHVRSL